MSDRSLDPEEAATVYVSLRKIYDDGSKFLACAGYHRLLHDKDIGYIVTFENFQRILEALVERKALAAAAHGPATIYQFSRSLPLLHS
jgi:hypothetical protein